MDNLCHTLVGGVLARAGLGRRTPRGAMTLMLAANLHDVDALAIFTGDALGFRRGVTHGLPSVVVLPVFLGLAVLLGDRLLVRDGPGRAHPREIFLLAWLGALTHPLLDWLNVYGMRWLMPLDGRWFYGDSVFVMDPWLWGMLGLGWLTARASPVPARVALLVAAVYVLSMVSVTNVGRRVAARDLGLVAPGPRALQVAPPFFASWRRDVIVDAGDRYRFGVIAWRPRPHLVLYEGALAKGLERLGVEGGGATGKVRSFLHWARFPFAEPASRGGEVVLRLDDARYARNGASFAAVYLPLTR